MSQKEKTRDLTQSHLESKETGLMLVEDPEDTIRVICQFRGRTLDLAAYKRAYEIMKKRRRPIHEKHAHTHFYTLSIYGLIVPCGDGSSCYRVSPIGNELCECLDRLDVERYRQILSNVLLNNPRKGRIFKKFLSFVGDQKKRSKQEVSERFKEIPARTLIAWSKSARLIEGDHDFVWAIPQKEKKALGMKQFQHEVIDTYNTLSKSEVFGLEKVFVRISELRRSVCIEHSLTFEEFNEYLTELLDSSFGERIRLYGAPASSSKETESFLYRNKLYVYFRVKV